MKSIGEIIRAEAEREEREANAFYAVERKRNAAEEMYEALDQIIFSATDGRDIPEWLEERLVDAKAAKAKADGK